MHSGHGNNFGPPHKGGPMIPESVVSPLRGQSGERKLTFSKVFRWRLPPGQTKAPATVEVAGSFNHWQKVPLHRDSEMDAWHARLETLKAEHGAAMLAQAARNSAEKAKKAKAKAKAAAAK